MNKVKSKGMKYIIVGFAKSGSTSLEIYMNKKGYDVVRHETLFCAGEAGSNHPYNPLEWYEKYFPDRQPIFVLRDPIKRVFSYYHYKQNHQVGDAQEIKQKTLRDALDKHPHIVKQSDYDRYLKQWQHKLPLILYLEDIKKWDGYPHDNVCDCKAKITNDEEQLIKSLIDYNIHKRYI